MNDYSLTHAFDSSLTPSNDIKGIHSLTPLLTYSYRLLTCSLCLHTPLLTYSLTHLLTHSLTPKFTPSLTHSLITQWLPCWFHLSITDVCLFLITSHILIIYCLLWAICTILLSQQTFGNLNICPGIFIPRRASTLK